MELVTNKYILIGAVVLFLVVKKMAESKKMLSLCLLCALILMLASIGETLGSFFI